MLPQRWLWAGLTTAALAIGPAVFAQSTPPPNAPTVSPAAVARAGAPIPQLATAHNEHEFTDQVNAWRRKAYFESFQQAATGKSWEKDGHQFVQDTLAELLTLNTGQPPKRWQILADRGRALITAGCNECVVRYLTTRCKFFFDSDKRVELAALKKILEDVEKDPGYRKAFAFIVVSDVRLALSKASDLDQKVLDLLGQAYEEGSYAGKDDAAVFILHLFNLADMEKSGDQVEQLVAGLKGLPDWARKTILGKVAVGRAWRARGHGWANSVTEEGKVGFKKGMENAQALLTEAWRQRPDQPYAPAEMVTVAMAFESEPSQTLRTWFDRAVSARFDFREAYTNYEEALMPRWGGSYEEALAFGLSCASTKRFETNAPERLVHVLEQIGKEISKRREVFQIPGVPDALMAMDKGYLAEPDRPGNLKLWQYNTLLDAWLCQRWADGKVVLDQLPDRIPTVGIVNRLKLFGLPLKDLCGEMEIYNSPAREEYARAKELDLQSRYSEAAPHYDAALKAAEGLPASTDLIAFTKLLNDFKVEFHKDQWTDVSPKSLGDKKWNFSNTAEFTVPESGTLQIVGRGETALATCRVMVGKNYELQADFEFLSPLEGRHLFAVALGESPTSPCVTCQMYFEKNSIGSLHVLRQFYNTSNPKFEVALQIKNHLQIRCQNKVINLSINGQPILEKFISVEGRPDDHFGCIGFGGYHLASDEGYRLTNILIRPIKPL